MFDNRQTKQEIIAGAMKIYAQYLDLHERSNIDALLLLRMKVLADLSAGKKDVRLRQVLKWIDELK